MSGLSQLFNTAATGLNAAAQNLQTVANNTANVNTAGYDVESVQQTELAGTPGQPGVGTQVTSIQRAFEQFVFTQMVGAGSANQAAQVAQDSAQNLTAIFPVQSGGTGGLGATLSGFFSAMDAVSQDPTSLPDRQTFLSNASELAANFNSVGNQLASNLTSLDGELTNAITQANTLVQQIASINNQVQALSAQGTAGPPSSLLDSRDNLVQQLGQQLGITVVAGPSNTVDIYTTGGDMLVNGASSASLTATSGSYGAVDNLSIIYQPNGHDITAGISGGTIGGVLGARAQVIAAQNSVGGLAAALATSVNTQQSLGLDLNGALGTALFSVSGPTVLADASNTGSGALNATITNTSAFSPTDYIVTKTATGYQATNITTGQVSALGNGPSLSLDGMTLAVSGTINTGDSFEIEPTTTSARTLKVIATDPGEIAAALAYVASPGNNLGNVAANSFSAGASGSLAAGTVIVPATYFGQNLSVKFTSATTFNVLSSSNAVIASGSFSTSNGAEIAIAYPNSAPAGEVDTLTLSPGAPATGDTFSLTPGGIASNGNILAMTKLSSQNLLSGQTLSSAYATLVGQVGSVGQAASFTATATQGVLNQVQSLQQSISGVNLDEQAADLISFQQAYQAAAQVIASAQTLFQSLLTAVHG
jgi:flagellar hook-associated protein 1